MRQHVRSGLIASIVAGLAAVAAAQQAPNAKGTPPATKAATPARPAILDQVLATVNGETITREELYRIFNTTGVPPGAESELDVYKIGMDGLVSSKLVKQYLQKQKTLDISEKEVDAEFADFEKKLKADGQDVNVALASHGITVTQVREDMKSALRWRKYLDAVATDANLKKFVADNKDVFNRTQVRASHIVLRVEPTPRPPTRRRRRQKLLGIKKEIDSGKLAFADAANKYSEDDGNKSSPAGGDLGFFVRRGQFNDQFTAAAFGLKKGVVSDPVETPFGYHLILVTDRKDGTPVDFEQQKLLIRNEYASDIHERIVAAEKKTAKIKVEEMPADLFPKAPPQQQPGAQPSEPGKAATQPAKAATQPGKAAAPPMNPRPGGIGRSATPARPATRRGRVGSLSKAPAGRKIGSGQVGEVEPARGPEVGEPPVGLGHAVDERGPRQGAEGGLEPGIVEVGRDRQLPVAEGHAVRPADLAEGGDEPLHRHDRAPDVVRVGPLVRRSQGGEEGRGDVADVLEVLEPAVADGVVSAGGDGLDRLGRLAGDAEVAAHAVDRPGAKADARDPAVEPVDPGVQLVADLEGPVMGQRGQPDLVADRPGRVGFGRAVDGGRTREDDPLDLPFERGRGLEDGERPQHVDPRPQQRDRRGRSGLGARRGGADASPRIVRPPPARPPRRSRRRRRSGRSIWSGAPRARRSSLRSKIQTSPVLDQVEDPDLAPFGDDLPGHPRTRCTHNRRSSARRTRASSLNITAPARAGGPGLAFPELFGPAPASSFSQVTGFSR